MVGPKRVFDLPAIWCEICWICSEFSLPNKRPPLHMFCCLSRPFAESFRWRFHEFSRICTALSSTQLFNVNRNCVCVCRLPTIISFELYRARATWVARTYENIYHCQRVLCVVTVSLFCQHCQYYFSSAGLNISQNQFPMINKIYDKKKKCCAASINFVS